MTARRWLAPLAHRECFATARCIAEALRNRDAPPTASITQLSPSDESSKTEAKGKSTALTGKTHIKVKGQWVYLYRGVDKEGQTIDFYLSERRDIAAAKRFLQQAIEKRGVPQKIPLDGYAASHEAVAALQEENSLPADLVVRTNRYLNNLIEQDHRHVKQRVRPMLGFKRFDYAAVTLAGIELVHQIKKGQFDISVRCSPQLRTPQVWETFLAA